jgi:two-component system, chemotaxis family, protein-glutamate methylesterase/glutaminase
MACTSSRLRLATRPLPDGGIGIREPSSIDVVAIAASLGGPEAVREIVAGLPAWFPSPILVVQHRVAAAELITVDLLRRATTLAVELAREGEVPRAGVVHVMPAGRDLVLARSGAFVSADTVGQHFPADALFGSAAACFGSRSVGVVLSGTNADGARGVVAIKRAGGCTIAQSRASARCFAMPAAAIASGCVDLVLPVERIAHFLVSVAAWPGARSPLRVPMAPWAVID